MSFHKSIAVLSFAAALSLAVPGYFSHRQGTRHITAISRNCDGLYNTLEYSIDNVKVHEYFFEPMTRQEVMMLGMQGNITFENCEKPDEITPPHGSRRL